VIVTAPGYEKPIAGELEVLAFRGTTLLASGEIM
jgi:hypothetical protein